MFSAHCLPHCSLACAPAPQAPAATSLAAREFYPMLQRMGQLAAAPQAGLLCGTCALLCERARGQRGAAQVPIEPYDGAYLQ